MTSMPSSSIVDDFQRHAIGKTLEHQGVPAGASRSIASAAVSSGAASTLQQHAVSAALQQRGVPPEEAKTLAKAGSSRSNRPPAPPPPPGATAAAAAVAKAIPGARAPAPSPSLPSVSAVAAPATIYRSQAPAPPPAPKPSSGPPPSNWIVTADAYQKYVAFFESLPRDDRGMAAGRDVANFLVQSGLPKPSIARILELSDLDGDKMFDRDEFALAMHLALCVSKRGMPLFDALPGYLIPKSKKGAELPSVAYT